MATQYGPTGSGFLVPTLEDIQFDVQNDMMGALPALSFDEGKVETGLVNVMSRLSYCMWQAINRSHNQSNPNFASSCALNILAAKNGVYRQDGESDSELRARLSSVTSGASTNFTGAQCFNQLQEDLFNITDVSDVQINVNDTPNQVGVLPPNSYEVMVIGGSSEEIANAIWTNHPVGITHVGNTSFQIIDCTGICRDVYFTRPKLVPMYVDVRVRRTAAICGCPTDDTDVICQAIFDYINEDGGSCFTRIGQSIHVQDFYAPVFSIQGIGITCALISRDGLCAEDEMVTLKRDEVPFFSKGCINVEFTSEAQSPCVTGNYSCPPDECVFSFDITKTADVTTFMSEGDTINYTYTVTNTSSGVIVDPIIINDDKATVTCSSIPSGGLPVGDSVTCTATYVTTYDDAINGFVTNKAQATSGTLISPCVELTIDYDGPELFHAMSLRKELVSGSCQNIGDVLTYKYTVTNTGTVPIITQPIISDDKIGGIICPALPSGGLLPNSSISTTATTIVTQQILDSGECCNTARARASSPLGSLVSNSVTLCIQCGNVGNTPPVCPDDLTLDCDADIPYTSAVFTDNSGDIVSLSQVGLPSGFAFTDNGNGTYTITGSGDSGVMTVTASDGSGGTCNQVVTVDGCQSLTPFCFDGVECPLTVTESQTNSFQIVFIAELKNGQGPYSINAGSFAAQGLNITADSSSGIVTADIPANWTGPLTDIITITDSSNQTFSCELTIELL